MPRRGWVSPWRSGPPASPPDPLPTTTVAFDPDDPLVEHLAQVAEPIALDRIDLDSPGVRALKAAGMALLVPLVTSGELVGLLALGPRRSEREYSTNDRRLLQDLATHAAPAVRVAQLVREQEAEVLSRQRIEQELHVARLIQQQFLPKSLPEMPGWHVAAHYQPAREVGGDFYDFLQLPGGQVGIVIGDVTDKGVPAALVMATTHSILRAEAARLLAPGEVLRRANALLVEEMPANMFVTCLYAVLDPASGRLRYANAGHDLPYLRRAEGVVELRATGMPLGLLPDMDYEEKEVRLEPGQGVLFHSDGVVEAHDPERTMFGFPRLKELVAGATSETDLIDRVLTHLAAFTGPDWEQEDDITLVTLSRTATAAVIGMDGPTDAAGLPPQARVLAAFTVASEPGGERAVLPRLAAAVDPLGLPALRRDALATAVAEATMNAIEHGNGNRPELPVRLVVAATDDAVLVTVTDRAVHGPSPEGPEQPDLDAKLAGRQSPRGWGLYLMRNLVDEVRTRDQVGGHTVELVLHRDGVAS
ncbi:ATP-binding SpoIIE family protein phosphatase [Blastococcus saxobsidens]|uniref:Serine phosphatase RsbU (Regulator of sigma subunit) n=1 Tax=Blastococcus saxobsidens TaxID=138336 RepID=A0A4Q7Y1X6_9ACTN|nr:SpoIIE family protein phosphatase [Blastococcus saxobsidens]RZU30797.1 serine phosphatase RsbU (regulator of sigma subunit) [Blastococcus saxobsidens]